MGTLNQLNNAGLYSSDPPYYTYGAPQDSLQPAQPQQGTELAQQQQPRPFAKGGEAATRSLAMLRMAAEQPEEEVIQEDSLQPADAPEGPLEPGARDPSFVEGPGTGRSDEIDAKLSDGEYVFDAETVALLGDGSSKAGAAQLDALRERIRAHKGAALAQGKISPDAKPAEQYLKGAK